MTQQPLRTKLLNRWGQLKTERSSWVVDWQVCGEFILPRSPRFYSEDRNRGGRRARKIIDDSATYSLRVLGAGLMAGATSPARPWFRLAAPDPELNEFYTVKLWLDDVSKRMMRVFQRSNFYRAAHQMYEEIAVFGTAACLVLPDAKNTIHLYPIPIGEFCLAQDFKGSVNTFYREFEISVAQTVDEFGFDNCSLDVQNRWKNGQDLDSGVSVLHAIEPRSDRDTSKVDARNMRWRSTYLEIGGRADNVLRESGFEHFPVIAPRWNARTGDVYGSSPGMDALGNIKSLQQEQIRKAEAIDYQTKPPLQLPTSMRNRDVESMPGGRTFVDGQGSQPGVRPMWEVRLDLSHLTADIYDVRQRIRQAFHTDLFLALIGGNDTQKTKAEIDAREQEKRIVLGPVMERLTTEMLSPAIELTFTAMMEAGQLPPPPPELQGEDLSVEFISMLAQAQRAIGTAATDRWVGNLVGMAQAKPEVLDKLNSDEWADSYASDLGVNPKLVVPDEQVRDIREARNRAMAAKEQAALMEQQAATVKDLGTTPSGSGTALDALGLFSGYGGAG